MVGGYLDLANHIRGLSRGVRRKVKLLQVGSPTSFLLPMSSQKMHHALEIHEILLKIFLYCHLNNMRRSDLPALARTCRTFKEPALDVLWEELIHLSPLAQCLPEDCHRISVLGYVKMVPSLSAAVYDDEPFFFQVLFILQVTYTGRMGYPSKLHTSHPIYAHT